MAVYFPGEAGGLQCPSAGFPDSVTGKLPRAAGTFTCFQPNDAPHSADTSNFASLCIRLNRARKLMADVIGFNEDKV